jgi:hypothetical protein
MSKIYLGNDLITNYYFGNTIVNIEQNLGALDQDTQNFVTASGITNQQTIIALNDLVLDLKTFPTGAAGPVWNKLYAIYPFVGGTSFTSRWNLKDTGSYLASFSGSGTPWIYDSNGVTSNAASGAFMNTNWNISDAPDNSSTTDGWNTSGSLSVYSRTSEQADYDMGVQTTGTTGNQTSLVLRNISNQFIAGLPTDPVTTATNTTGSGFFVASRASNVVTGWRNKVQLLSTTRTIGAFYGNYTKPMYLAAINGNAGAEAFSSRNYAFCSIGGTLSVSDANALADAVEAFQIALGRNV